MKVLVRTDGGVQIGNGHIIRMQALANEFVKRGVDFEFALKLDDFWISKLTDSGVVVNKLNDKNNDDLPLLLGKKNFTHFVYDTRNDLQVDDLNSIRKKFGVKVIVIDSPEEVRLSADAVLYPPIPQVEEWNWKGFSGKLFSGWDYVLLRNEFTGTSHLKSKTNRILLSFGSTDPFHLTEWAIDQIDRSKHLFGGYEFLVMVGPQFNRIDELTSLIASKKLGIEIVQAPNDVSALYKSIDFAIIALGVTAYELAAMGVPFLFVAISDDHARSGSVFEDRGLGLCLGIINKTLNHFDEKATTFMQKHLAANNQDTSEVRPIICDWSKIMQAILN